MIKFFFQEIFYLNPPLVVVKKKYRGKILSIKEYDVIQ